MSPTFCMDFAVSANALGASRLFHSEIVTAFYFLSGVKSCFFYFLNDLKALGGCLVSCIPTHACYLGTTCMLPWCPFAKPTYSGSAGDQQLPPLLKPRRHPSYERTSIPHHFSFIPKPYSLQATFDTICTTRLEHGVP